MIFTDSVAKNKNILLNVFLVAMLMKLTFCCVLKELLHAVTEKICAYSSHKDSWNISVLLAAADRIQRLEDITADFRRRIRIFRGGQKH